MTKWIFIQQIIDEILETTEGSPLYMEDLLRLCSVLSPEVAIAQWKNRKGDEARQYALQMEFDKLTPLAKKIVVACCIPGVSVSLAEIRAISALSQEQVMSEMKAIHNLFLISRPKLIDGENRFDVNANTRRLILHTFQKTDLLNRLEERYKGLLGQRGFQGKSEIASYIRKAISLQHLGKHEDAEQLLLRTLDRYPSNPELIAQLGIVYSHWQPHRRRADAREQFKRAAQLKCSYEWMYRSWADMESETKEWTAAIEAAEVGIKLASTPSKELYYLAGMAHTRYGQDLKSGLHDEKASREFVVANRLLLDGLKDPEELADYAARKSNSRIFRALVLNYEALGQLDKMHEFLDRWLNEHPDDSYAISEGDRLRTRYPRLRQNHK